MSVARFGGIVLTMALAAVAFGATAAKADKCDDLIAQEKRIGAKESAVAKAFEEERETIRARYRARGNENETYLSKYEETYRVFCTSSKIDLENLQQKIGRRKVIEATCGKRVTQNCDSACWRNWIAGAKENVRSHCAEADRIALLAAKQRAANAAAAPATPSAPAQVSGANTPSPPNTPAATAASTPRRPWSGLHKDCDSAGPLEQKTAAWYNMCVPADPAALERLRPNAYEPPISPQWLTALAINECKDVQFDSKRQCIFSFKLKTLLADDPNIRAECSSRAGKDQIECVDAVFLYGPGAHGKIAERENRRRKIAAMPAYRSADTVSAAAPSAPPNLCPPGQGMKPTPGAFGARSCQPLGLIWLARDRPKPEATSPQGTDAANASDLVQAFEERVNEIAAFAVVTVPHLIRGPLSAADRETCSNEAFAAVHGTLKGGTPVVSEKCRPMAGAARAELAYYAHATIDTVSNPGVEELLSSFTARGDLGAAQPGLIGLTPDPQKQRQGECMLRGGTAESCSGVETPRPGVTAVAADCTQAETHWKSAEEIKSLAAYQDHLARFPSCNFAVLAAARIEQLRK